MTKISVIIPTLGEAATLPKLVDALRTQGFDEIIIADSSDDTFTLEAANRVGVLCLHGLAKCRGGQMHVGAQMATGDTLFFLHADSILPENAYQAIRAAIARPETIAGSFRLAFDHPHQLLSFYAWCSRLNWSIATYGDQGLFVRRTIYKMIGGYRPLALMEDFEIQGRLRPVGRFIKLTDCITTSPRRFLRRGILRQQLLNILIVTAFLCKVPPHILARWYEAKPKSKSSP